MCNKNITKASHVKEWYREYLSEGLFPIKRYYNRQTDRGKLTVVVVRWFFMTGASSKPTGSEIRTEPRGKKMILRKKHKKIDKLVSNLLQNGQAGLLLLRYIFLHPLGLLCWWFPVIKIHKVQFYIMWYPISTIDYDCDIINLATLCFNFFCPKFALFIVHVFMAEDMILWLAIMSFI